jgi:heptosyltransferase-3
MSGRPCNCWKPAYNRRRPVDVKPVKLLLAKLNHLGDTLLLTPTIHFLKEHFPDAEVDVLVRAGCEEVLRGNPDVRRIFSVGAPQKNKNFFRNARGILLRRYDYAFDLSDSGKAKLWISLSAARIRGVNDAYRSVGWKWRLFNRISDFEWGIQHQVLRDFRTVTDIMELKGEPGPLRFYPQAESENLRNFSPASGYAVIHPASRWAFKQWLPERWAAVADALRRERGLQVIFSCGPNDREKNLVREILDRCAEKHSGTDGKLSLDELGRLLQGAKIFLGVDTVAMHLAAAMRTPVVALFGPSAEWSWHPWQCRHELALGECPCKQARKFVCDKSKPYPCMERITVEMVLAKAGKLLGERAG